MKHITYILVLLCLFSCSTKDESKNTLTIGISADYPPFEMVIDNQIVGFDAELAKEISTRLGYEMKFKEMDFSSLIPSIQNKSIDFAISNIAKNSDREKLVDFTDPYFYSGNALLFKKELKITTLNDLKNKRIGVQLGTIFENHLKKQQVSKHIIALSRIPVLVEELKNNRVDAIVLDKVQALEYVARNQDFGYIEIDKSGEGSAIALPKHSELTSKINQIIKDLEQEGYLKTLENKWLVEFSKNQTKPKVSVFNFDTKYLLIIASGIKYTLFYATCATIFGFILGILALAISNINTFTKCLVEIYVSILRGTPLILQLSIMYFALPALLDIKIPIVLAGLIAFSVNSSAYIFEHLKSGVKSVDNGQIEAAKSLGMTKFMILRLIVIPQAFKTIMPSLINEAINLVKESSLISVFGVADIMRQSQLISSQTYDYLTPLLFAGLYYYIIVLLLNIVLKKIERKFI